MKNSYNFGMEIDVGMRQITPYNKSFNLILIVSVFGQYQSIIKEVSNLFPCICKYVLGCQ